MAHTHTPLTPFNAYEGTRVTHRVTRTAGTVAVLLSWKEPTGQTYYTVVVKDDRTGKAGEYALYLFTLAH